jgi:hypothetical protein
VVFAGPPAELCDAPESLTGHHLRLTHGAGAAA